MNRSHVARSVYICWQGHARWYLTVINEQGNERRGGGGGGRIKIGKESRLSPVINGGIPTWREGEEGEDLDSLRKNTACLARRESRQLSILIKASQPARRRQKTMAGSIAREGRRGGRNVGQRERWRPPKRGEGFRWDGTDEKSEQGVLRPNEEWIKARRGRDGKTRSVDLTNNR